MLGDITNTIAGGRGNDVGSLHYEKLQMPHKMQAAAAHVGEATEPDLQPPCTPRSSQPTEVRTPGRTPGRTPARTPASARGTRTPSQDMSKTAPVRLPITRAASAKELRTPQPAKGFDARAPQRAALTPVRVRAGASRPVSCSSSASPSRCSRSVAAGSKADHAKHANELTQVDQNVDELKKKLNQAMASKEEHLAKHARYQKQQEEQAQQLHDAQDGHKENMAAENLRESELGASLGVNLPEHCGEVAKGIAMTAGIDAKVGSLERLRLQIVEVKDAQLAMGEKEKEKAHRADAIGWACQDAEASLNDLKRILVENIVHNRQLHNTYLSLKGNIRVFCRLRPQLRSELEGEPLKVELQEDGQMTVRSELKKNITGERDISSSWGFDFDQIFAQDATQAGIFEEIALLVQSALDGYRVAIFAYGQTGSGKTHTMEGLQGSAEGAGIIPRTVDLIFSEMREMKERGWSFQVHVTMIEVYNETIIDLLAPKCGASGAVTPRDREGAVVRDACSHEGLGEQYRQVTVDSAASVHHFISRASRERHVAATACNDRSSRSHAVFQLKLVGKCDSGAEGGREVDGLLSLVDLAGSERVEKSQATGDRLREAQNINRSLSALGDVVEALARRGPSGSKHVPYRNSKLTMLLKESLGGESKALMFVNVSMCLDHLGETLSSLRFASKVHACNVGVAKRVVKAGGC